MPLPPCPCRGLAPTISSASRAAPRPPTGRGAAGVFPAQSRDRVPDAGADQQGGETIRQDILICLPERLHPVSQMFLENWLAGDMTTAEFLRWFHMPNSAYLPVAKCVLAVVAGA